MTRARFGLKTLGTCLLVVLGMTALMASGAQASWLIGGNPLNGERALQISAHSESILQVPAKLLEKLCTTVSAGAGSKIETVIGAPLNYILVILNFTNCQTIANHVVVPGCRPAEPVVIRAEGELFLHNGDEYILLTPDDAINNRFGRLDFPAATCALPDTNLTGSMVLECLTASLTAGDCLTNEVNHRVSQAPVALFPGHGLLFGANAAALNGVMNFELVSGEVWSGHD